jgi:hypothetical protein
MNMAAENETRYIPAGYGFNINDDFARAPHDLLLQCAQYDSARHGYRGKVAAWDGAALGVVRSAWKSKGAVPVFVRKDCTKTV